MSSKNIGGGRALRVCDICGGVDDHPRHVLAGGLPGQFPPPTAETLQHVMDTAPSAERGRLALELMDTGSSDRHMDCCRTAGCPTGQCDKLPDLIGADLVKHIMDSAEAAS
jgi:hypothetical protein